MDLKGLLLHSFRGSRRLTQGTVEAMPAEEMDYRPTPEQMSFGEQVLHNLSCYITLTDALAGKGWEWNKGITLERYPTKEAILAFQEAETERLLTLLESQPPEWFAEEVATGWGTTESIAGLLLSWISHEDHHRGQLVVYLRLKGCTPPKY